MQLKYIVVKNVVSQDQSEYVVEAEATVINTTQAKLNEGEPHSSTPGAMEHCHTSKRVPK